MQHFDWFIGSFFALLWRTGNHSHLQSEARVLHGIIEFRIDISYLFKHCAASRPLLHRRKHSSAPPELCKRRPHQPPRPQPLLRHRLDVTQQ